ncbi:hypothetical protein JCM3765_000502 [Sporobolomyces pararoseus]
MLVRIRSKDGNFRFDLQPTDDISALVNKILETSELIDPATLALSNQPRGGENLVSSIVGDLQTLGINHGDLLFASYQTRSTPSALSSRPHSGTATPLPSTSTSTSTPLHASTLSGKVIPLEPETATNAATSSPDITNHPLNAKNVVRVPGGKKPWEGVKENPVDEYWEKRDGKIQREKGKNGCRCGPKSMCDYCMPLEPFDAEYQASQNIKHLSYHSYLKKLHASIPTSAQASTYIPPLADPSYRVQVPCSSGSHPSWPAGICTKCQPSAVTLSRQTYRMTDHVEFATPSLIDGLLSFWRSTGTQRFGYLLGTYQPYDKVPMGVKAVVEAIHEPPQEPLGDGITVGFPWEEESKVEALAQACGGLEIVGIVFTDLTQDVSTEESKKLGKVVAKRHANSFFLSSLEVLFSATLQSKFPMKSRFSIDGKFSSRFVTCVVSGDIEGQISVEAYQVSDQAMAMVDADMVEASVDPGVVRVKEEGKERYIPDVFYRYKNKYGLEVKDNAKPCFPVEYLIVNVSHGFPVSPNPLFTTTTPFTHENRTGLSDQTLSSVSSSFISITRQISSPELLSGSSGQSEVNEEEKNKGLERLVSDQGVMKFKNWLSDWHLLRFLADCGMFEEEDIRLLCKIATIPHSSSNSTSTSSLETLKTLAESLSKLFSSPNFQTFLLVAQEQASSNTTNTLPTKDYPGGGGIGEEKQMIDGFEIPPDVDVPPEAFNNNNNNNTNNDNGQGNDNAMGGGDGNAAGGAGGMQVCPHCTFENNPGVQDCEICGLPLSG